MVITFLQQRKRQQYLILITLVIILLILIVVWQGFLAKPKPAPSPTVSKLPQIKINFEVLESPILKKLQPFEKIPPFEEEIGRENPFLPY